MRTLLKILLVVSLFVQCYSQETTIARRRSSAAAPVITTQTIHIAANGDDAKVVPGWGNYFDAGNCTIGDEGTPEEAGFRFLGLNTPKNATIISAYITLTSNSVSTADNVNVRIKGESNATPATFSTYNDFAGRTRTTALVDWSTIPHWAFFTTYNTPEIKTIVQEIVNLAGWGVGQNITLFIANNSSTASANRAVNDYSASAPDAAILYVQWSVP